MWPMNTSWMFFIASFSLNVAHCHQRRVDVVWPVHALATKASVMQPPSSSHHDYDLTDNIAHFQGQLEYEVPPRTRSERVWLCQRTLRRLLLKVGSSAAWQWFFLKGGVSQIPLGCNKSCPELGNCAVACEGILMRLSAAAPTDDVVDLLRIPVCNGHGLFAVNTFVVYLDTAGWYWRLFFWLLARVSRENSTFIFICFFIKPPRPPQWRVSHRAIFWVSQLNPGQFSNQYM